MEELRAVGEEEKRARKRRRRGGGRGQMGRKGGKEGDGWL